MLIIGSLAPMGCGARSDIDSPDRSSTDGGSPALDGAPIETDFPGVYACRSTVSGVYHADGKTFFYAGGATGILRVTKTSSALTTTYEGDHFAHGSSTFAATSHDSANPLGEGQSLQVIACTQQMDLANTLDIRSGSLTMDGTTVIWSLVGVMDWSSLCPGADVVLSIRCARS